MKLALRPVGKKAPPAAGFDSSALMTAADPARASLELVVAAGHAARLVNGSP
jgi:hypothetical protein